VASRPRRRRTLFAIFTVLFSLFTALFAMFTVVLTGTTRISLRSMTRWNRSLCVCVCVSRGSCMCVWIVECVACRVWCIVCGARAVYVTPCSFLQTRTTPLLDDDDDDDDSEYTIDDHIDDDDDDFRWRRFWPRSGTSQGASSPGSTFASSTRSFALTQCTYFTLFFETLFAPFVP
jgi:hypothetical protein